MANLELREGFTKQDLARDIRDNQEALKKLRDELELARLQEKRLKEESNLHKTELAQLRGIIDEGDRSREILIRELARAKEQESERIRETE